MQLYLQQPISFLDELAVQGCRKLPHSAEVVQQQRDLSHQYLFTLCPECTRRRLSFVVLSTKEEERLLKRNLRYQQVMDERLLIRETQKLPQVMEMNTNQILIMKKLDTFQILKEAFKIPFKNPRFIILTFLTSFPLFFIILLHETILQKAITETKEFLNPPPPPPPDKSGVDRFIIFQDFLPNYWEPINFLMTMFPRLLQLSFLYMVPFHFLDLINTITTVDSASMIYRVERTMGLKEMLLRPIKETRFMGPLIASLYILSLNLLILFGLIWAVTNSIIASIFGSFYVMGSIIATMKWLDWSALWNMGMVFSVLEERDGLQALGAATYYSRGNRTRGFYLMLIFFVLRNGLRFICVYLGGHERLDVVVATSVLSCVLNVMKWVVFMVYYCDCKKRVMQKKVDVEEGWNVVDAANMGST